MDCLLLDALAAAFLLVFIAVKTKNPDDTVYKHVVGLALVATFFWPWIAVGVGIGRVTDLASMMSLGVLGVIIIGAVIAYKETKTHNTAYRSAVGVALATAFILNWMIPAVGVLGRDGDPADLMYMGVLAVGIIGALIARFQPQGMARALFATALAQALVATIALIAGMHRSPISSVGEILRLNGFFAALWVGSALLFQHAARKNPPVGAAPEG